MKFKIASEILPLKHNSLFNCISPLWFQLYQSWGISNLINNIKPYVFSWIKRLNLLPAHVISEIGRDSYLM